MCYDNFRHSQLVIFNLASNTLIQLVPEVNRDFHIKIHQIASQQDLLNKVAANLFLFKMTTLE